jgi:formate dehydrogenase major subunit
MPRWFDRWPLIAQLRHGADPTGSAAKSTATRALRSPLANSQIARTVCPYCGVGCGQLVYHDGARLLGIEGDPESPINQGTLCPKGSASYELLTHSRRLSKVMYRAPRSDSWQELDLGRAMQMIADRIWETRQRSFIRDKDGIRLGHTTAIAHLGGATLDNEENYLIKKLFTGGLGMVAVSNQARI